MSRIAKNPIAIPAGVTVEAQAGSVTVKGPKGSMHYPMPAFVTVTRDDKYLHVNTSLPTTERAGAVHATIKNMFKGITVGFERKLELVGVGYRAQMQGKQLQLTLGFSHPVHYQVPEGITIESPSQTEVVIKGMDKRLVGQVAAEIRRYRSPEPYKGKGVRYAGEVIKLKETKKK